MISNVFAPEKPLIFICKKCKAPSCFTIILLSKSINEKTLYTCYCIYANAYKYCTTNRLNKKRD